MNLDVFVNQLKTTISDYLEPYKDKYSNELFDFKIFSHPLEYDYSYEIEVKGQHKNEYSQNKQTEFILLRMQIYSNNMQVHISNIFLPKFMIHNGIGKKLIKEIFIVSKEHKFNLFIVDMVQSFYQKMIARGALPCNEADDAVGIVDSTNLD